MIDTDVFDADAAAITADLPTTMTLRGKSFSVMSGEVDVSQKGEFEGLWGENAVLLVVRTALFDAAIPPIQRPMNNETFTLSSSTKEWRIHGIKTAPDGVTMQINGVCKTS